MSERERERERERALVGCVVQLDEREDRGACPGSCITNAFTNSMLTTFIAFRCTNSWMDSVQVRVLKLTWRVTLGVLTVTFTHTGTGTGTGTGTYWYQLDEWCPKQSNDARQSSRGLCLLGQRIVRCRDRMHPRNERQLLELQLRTACSVVMGVGNISVRERLFLETPVCLPGT